MMAVGFDFIFGWEKPNRFSQAFLRMKSLSNFFCRGHFILGKKYCTYVRYGTLHRESTIEKKQSALRWFSSFITTTPPSPDPLSPYLGNTGPISPKIEPIDSIWASTRKETKCHTTQPWLFANIIVWRIHAAFTPPLYAKGKFGLNYNAHLLSVTVRV